jgi:hypothetical protein
VLCSVECQVTLASSSTRLPMPPPKKQLYTDHHLVAKI